MKREEASEEYLRLFDFADSNHDGKLNANEFNRYVAAKGLFPGVKREVLYDFQNKPFDEANTNWDEEISEEELEACVKSSEELLFMQQNFQAENQKIPHRDKEVDLILGGISLATSVGAGVCKTARINSANLPINKRFIKYEKFIKGPVTKFNKVIESIGKWGGLIVAGMAIADLVMANNEEKKRNNLKNEYIDKVNDFIKENPNSTSAKEFVDRLIS